MSQVVQGVIHGRTIELRNDPGIAEGAAVEVTIRPATAPEPDTRTAAILRTAGALAHLPQEDWDAIDSIVRERQGAGRHRGING